MHPKTRARLLPMKPTILIVRALLAGAAGLCGRAQPVITTPPFAQAVEAGVTVSFRVVAFGEAPLAYHCQYRS